MKVHLLVLNYSIRFRDSDEGNCYAGDGQQIISAHSDKNKVKDIMVELNPIMSLAEQENIVFPIQKNNRILKKRLGFTLHDIDNGYNFSLNVETFNVE